MNKRLRYILKLCPPLLLIICVIFSCSNSSLADSEQYLEQQLNPSWTPILWFKKDSILFGDKENQGIFTYNPRTKEKGQFIETGPITIDCLDLDKKLLYLIKLEQSENSTFYSYGSYLDLKEMKIKQLKKGIKIVRGIYNCYTKPESAPFNNKTFPFKYKGEQWYTTVRGMTQNLFKDSAGSLVSMKAEQRKNQKFQLFFYKRNKIEKLIEMPIPINQQKNNKKIKYRSSYDSSTNKYLIYQITNSFSASMNTWPLKAWIFNSKNSDYQEVDIPPGPWVRNYSIADAKKGFSCGVSCYTKMKMALIGEKIIISVYGKLIKEANKGLYELQDGKWKKFSPIESLQIINGIDGCKMAVAGTKANSLFNLCRKV